LRSCPSRKVTIYHAAEFQIRRAPGDLTSETPRLSFPTPRIQEMLP